MQLRLTNYVIKLLAATFMVIDHVGYLFFPDVYALRAVGRLSFPLFAWLLVQGEAHTRDVRQYGLRLLILGLVSQPLYWLAFQDTEHLNILFTLLIGLACLRGSRLHPSLQLLIWIAGALVTIALRAEYDVYGIAVIAFVQYFRPQRLGWWVGWGLLHGILIYAEPNYGGFQFPAIASALFFLLANHQPGAKARWFYLFYPAHLLILALIDYLLP